jgi:putative membrane protein
MTLTAHILIALIAVFHLWFLILEMFLWTKPTGLRVFRQSLERAQNSAVLAANQGLYNGFLAAGLIWGLLYPDPVGRHIMTFFLTCIMVAGIYGGHSVSRRIFWIQAFPAILALGLLWVPRLQEQLL